MANVISTVALAEVAGVLLNDKALFGEWFFLYLRLGINTQGLHELALAYMQSRRDDRRSSFSLFKSIIHQWAQTKGTRATVCYLVNFLRKMQHGIIADELLRKFPDAPNIIIPWEINLRNPTEAAAEAFRRHYLGNEEIPNVDESIQQKTRGGVKILDMIKEPRPGQPRILIYLTQLIRILSLPEVQNIPVVIVSINGRRRAGKSFLSTQFVKYLKFGHLPNNQWIDTDLDSSFEWRQSHESVTYGIQIWHDPFIVEADEKKIAVVLMDTQGLHDKSAGSEENTMIFALSSLLSSVFIYNEKNDAAEDSLQYLHNFLECAKFLQTGMATSSSSGSEIDTTEIAFQKLVLLLRDFECEQHYALGYHYDSRKRQHQVGDLFKDTFDEIAGMHEVARATRRGIRSCFKDISVYAMAGPGSKRPDRPGCQRSSQWEPEFRTGIIDFVTKTLSPENLLASTKKVFGKEVTGLELRAFAYNWGELVRKCNFESKTILQTTMDTHYNNQMDTCVVEYIKKMSDYVLENYKGVSTIEFNSFHEKTEKDLLGKFCQGKRFGGKEIFYKYTNELLKKLGKEKEFFVKVNAANQAGESVRVSESLKQKIKDAATSAGLFLGGVSAGAVAVVGVIFLL